jgi:hypothetical protein
MLFLQDGLYLKVDLHNINNFTRGAWKRSIKLFGKVSCRHGCSIESKTFEDTLEHYLNCPMAPKKVNITGHRCKMLTYHAEVLTSKTCWIVCIFLLLTLISYTSNVLTLHGYIPVAGPSSSKRDKFLSYVCGRLINVTILNHLSQPISIRLLLITFFIIQNELELKILP